MHEKFQPQNRSTIFLVARFAGSIHSLFCTSSGRSQNLTHVNPRRAADTVSVFIHCPGAFREHLQNGKA